MSDFMDVVGEVEEVSPDNIYDQAYHGHMYLIESALRDLGAEAPRTEKTRSPYDAALMKLINAVPLR